MNEPTLFDALKARDEAMAAVEENADEQWRSYAWDWLVDYLRTHDEFFPDSVWGAGLTPPRERRAFGPLVQRAAREGLIRKTGRTRQRVRGHGTPAEIWESTIYERDVA
jgi:hypothetical protein